MTYFPNNPNGQATMANSAPVVVASDQSTLPVSLSGNQPVNLTQVASNNVLTSGVTGSQAVGGDTASAVTDAGNPVKVGAKFNSTPPTFTDGQRGDLQITSRGELNVNLKQNNSSVAVATSQADASSNTVVTLAAATYGKLFNGSTWDRSASVLNATDSVGTGITAAGILAQFDDSSPTAITENRFGNLRISSNRNLYNTIRDAAGNERGANVTAANALVVDNSVVSPAQAPVSTALNTYAVRITTNTTTTPTSSTAYISSITITTEVAGTTSTVTIRDKQGTPQVLVNAFTTTAASLTPTVINFQTPIKMTSGIDIITAGAVAGTVDVWVNYYQ